MFIFESPVDRRTQSITITGVAIIFTVILIVITTGIGHTIKGIIILLFLIPIIILWQLSSRKYIIGEQAILIKHPVFQTKIPVKSVTQVVKIPEIEVKSLKRNLNTRGFMGYLGSLWLEEYGLVSLHCNSLNDLLLVITDKKSYIINPSSQLSFMEALHPHRSQSIH